MDEVSLADEPFEVAVGGGLDAFSAQGRLFLAVAHRIGFVALFAIFFVEQSAG